jgi:transcriptional regulator with XRE-family HTH domain
MGKQQTFGQKIRELRKDKNLSLRALSEQVSSRVRNRGKSFSFTYLSRIENGWEPPSIELITELAAVLDEDPLSLILLAGKVPPKFKTLVQQNEAARTFFRCLLDADLTPEDWSRLLRAIRQAP